HVAQALHIGIERGVRALHDIALIVQDFGDAAHADAADTDEMHRPQGFRHVHERVFPSRFLPESISARSASFSTARGWPSARAAAAALTRLGGSVNKSVR